MSEIIKLTNEDESRYHRLLASLTDYIYTVHVYQGATVKTIHGPGVFAVTGYSSKELHEDPGLWHRMVHEKDREIVIERAEKAIKGFSVEQVTHRIIHKNGTVKWVSNHIVLHKDEKGFLHFYDGLIKDITNLKTAELQAEIKQKQLIHADKMASLGILVSGVAHEVSNPNNFILLNIKLFQKIWLDIQPILDSYYKQNGDFVVAGMPYGQSVTKITMAMKAIYQGSLRIKDLVSRLVNYARQDAEEFEGKVDIETVVNGAVMIVNNLIKKSTDDFQIIIKDKHPATRGNSLQIEQVLINLISNACHSLQSRDQKIRVIVSFKKGDKYLKIKVKDQGKGISEDDLQRVFDPFFTTKRDYGGTGLGLSISQNIMKNHGGDLILKSKVKRGTTAVMVLPAVQ